MTVTRILAAASLGLALAACSGQQAEGTAAETEPAAGEMPQAGDTGTVTGSADAGVAGTDTAPVTTSADASAMGEGVPPPADPMTGATEPAQDPMQQTDPALEGTTQDPQDTTTPPPGQ